MNRHPRQPELSGSVLTSLVALSNNERKAIFYWKRSGVEYYRAIRPAAKEQQNEPHI